MLQSGLEPANQVENLRICPRIGISSQEHADRSSNGLASNLCWVAMIGIRLCLWGSLIIRLIYWSEGSSQHIWMHKAQTSLNRFVWLLMSPGQINSKWNKFVYMTWGIVLSTNSVQTLLNNVWTDRKYNSSWLCSYPAANYLHHGLMNLGMERQHAPLEQVWQVIWNGLLA